MRVFVAILVTSVAIINLACTDNSPPVIKPNQDGSLASAAPQITEDTQRAIPPLIQEIEQTNDNCRDLPGDSTEGIAACEKRDRLMQEAEKTGWCWGPQEAYGYEKHWIQCSEDPARMPKRQWFAHDINHAYCMESLSPADKIRELYEFGQMPKTNDLTAGAVEVEVNIGNGKSQVWTFYRSADSCEATLPRNQKIDGKYE